MFNTRIISIMITAFFVFLTVTVMIPSMPGEKFKRVAQVAEAFGMLDALREPVATFYAANQRFPSIDELRPARVSGKFIARLEGANPYIAVLKDDATVAAEIRGGRVEWRYDPASGQWDRCSGGTVAQQYKPLVCRRKAVVPKP